MKNRVKVNVDATIFDSSNCYSVVIVARSHTKEFIEALSSCKAGRVAPELAEGIGMKEVLSWVKA